MSRANLVTRIFLGVVVVLSLMAAGCSWVPSPAGIELSVTPATAYIPVSSSLQFGVTVTGTPNSQVVWSAGGQVGGNATVGFITSTGFYRAPANVPSPAQVTITATSEYDAVSSSSATVTVIGQTSGAHTVHVASGQTITNINVVAPQLTPTLTIYGAGTCVGSTCSTSAIGAQATQGSTATIFLVGSGVVEGTVYSISGNSSDVTVTQPAGSQFGQTTNGTPSVTFNISVSSTATPGLRNILVSNPATGELSAFVGGLLIASASGQ